MRDQELRDQIARQIAKDNGFENPGPFEHEQASRIYARAVAPLLADAEAELAQTRGKLGEALGNHHEAREQLANAEAMAGVLADQKREAEASRRDWAAEALRLDNEVEKARASYAQKLNDFARETACVSAALQACDPDRVPINVVGEAGLGYEAAQRDIARAVEQAVSRPVCAVHPEGGPLGCTCPSPLVSSASDCPSHGHAAMQGEFVSGWDFRCDTCRSRDHRHPQSGCHLVGCPCAVRSSPSVHPGEKP